MIEIDRLFNERYDYLLECCHNSLRLIRRTDLDSTLLADAYVYVTENQEKLKDKIKQGLLESIVVNWTYKQVIWSNTQFKKNWIYKDKIDINTSVDIEENSSETMDDKNKSILYYIQNLMTDDEESLENELMDQHRLTFIYGYISSLPLHRRILFDNIFKEGIDNSGKLSRHIGISRTTCWKMIKELKDDIRTAYQEQSNKNI